MESTASLPRDTSPCRRLSTGSASVRPTLAVLRYRSDQDRGQRLFLGPLFVMLLFESSAIRRPWSALAVRYSFRAGGPDEVVVESRPTTSVPRALLTPA